MNQAPAGVLTRGWVAVVLKHALVSSLACWALWVQMAYRVPSQVLFALLPWVGAATTVLSLTILVNHVLDAVATAGPFRQALRRFEWSASLVVRAFIYYSLVLFANAKLDVGGTTDRPSEVRAISAVRPVLGGLAPYGWITLRSWEEAGDTIRLVLRPDERDRFWVGEAVVVEQGRGRLRIPWVARIVPDRERRNRAILDVAPAAAQAWQDLIAYYRERGRFGDAADAALRYFAIYPRDWTSSVSEQRGTPKGGLAGIGGLSLPVIQGHWCFCPVSSETPADTVKRRRCWTTLLPRTTRSHSSSLGTCTIVGSVFSVTRAARASCMNELRVRDMCSRNA